MLIPPGLPASRTNVADGVGNYRPPPRFHSFTLSTDLLGEIAPGAVAGAVSDVALYRSPVVCAAGGAYRLAESTTRLIAVRACQ